MVTTTATPDHRYLGRGRPQRIRQPWVQLIVSIRNRNSPVVLVTMKAYPIVLMTGNHHNGTNPDVMSRNQRQIRITVPGDTLLTLRVQQPVVANGSHHHTNVRRHHFSLYEYAHIVHLRKDVKKWTFEKAGKSLTYVMTNLESVTLPKKDEPRISRIHQFCMVHMKFFMCCSI